MERLTRHELPRIAYLFDDTEESMVWSVLQGCMGEAWVDAREHPTAAQLLVADFCFLAGDSSTPQAAELVQNKGDYERSYLLMVPFDEGWSHLIEQQHGRHQKRCTRYAIKKEANAFDLQRLAENVAALPENYTLRRIDRELFQRTAEENWCSDFCRWYPTWEEYEAHGVGFLILDGDVMAAGVSSYTWYNGGIELEIDTKKEYRRRGLATICASRLILDCLERGLYPSWDAENLWSVALAEKLGYHFDKEYTTYLVRYGGSSFTSNVSPFK